MSESTVGLPPGEESPELATRFAFGGEVGAVLRSHFKRDAQQARLSRNFKLYYHVRPFVPLPVRHFLQRGRSRGILAPQHWFLPVEFLRDFREAVRTEPDAVAIHPWPDGFQIAVTLTHDVETEIGFARVDHLAALEEQYGLRSAWNFVPYKYKIDSGLVADLKERGHEIGVHGYNHDGRLFLSKRTFDRRTLPINQALRRFGSTGFRAPMVHRNLQWLQSLNIDYDASCFDVEPFQAMPGGVGGVWPFFAGKFVELPYTLPQDHTLLVSLGETSPRVWFEKMDLLRQLAGMALLITHPDYLDTPERLNIYEQFLAHVAERTDCWKSLPHQVTRWWRQRESLEIVGHDRSAELVGPGSARARTMLLGDLL